MGEGTARDDVNAAERSAGMMPRWLVWMLVILLGLGIALSQMICATGL